MVMTKPTAFSEQERDAVYRVLAERRDVRHGYTPELLPETLLRRLLGAAHCAPSVGLMQPSRFVVVRDRAVRESIHSAFLEANEKALANYEGERRDLYSSLKLEGIVEAPQNLCVLSDPDSERGHRLGRQTMPETAVYSTVCAIQNLWLAARSEGVGVGWVSILDPARLRAILGIPPEIVPVAYLCIGFVDQFADSPELERLGWEKQIPLDQVVSYDRFQQPIGPGEKTV
jgi:5,6-dimethylbenzimidazole synthase